MYTPISIDVFCAAYAGALGGYQKGRVPSSTITSQYARVAEAALAFASEFDAQFAVVLPNELQLQEIETLAASILTYPNNATTALVPGTYARDCNAIIAMMSEASSVVAANIPTPIPVPTPIAQAVLTIPTVVGVTDSLMSTIPVSPVSAIVGGYYAATDGGSAPAYLWDTTSVATHNGGTVLNPTGHVGAGRWFALYTGAVDARWFGASPTQTALVNTAAFIAAASWQNAQGGGIVKVWGACPVVTQNPAGTNFPMRLENFVNVVFEGYDRYVDGFIDAGAMATIVQPAIPGVGNALVTFAGYNGCGCRNMLLQGANVWSQPRLDTGITIETKKGVYFEWVDAGHTHKNPIFEDCYVTAAEGEAIFADGNPASLVTNLQWNRNHIFQCQTNALNTSGQLSFQGGSICDNFIDSPGQSAFQVSCIDFECSRNVTVMNGGFITYADVVVLAGCKNFLFNDNIYDGFKITLAARVLIGFGSINGVDTDVSIERNIISNCELLYAAGNFNGMIVVSSALDAQNNISIKDNQIVRCKGTTGDASQLVAIRYSGAGAMSGVNSGNRIDNEGVGGGLDTGIRIEASVPGNNGLVIEQQSITVATPFSFAVAPSSQVFEPPVATTAFQQLTWDGTSYFWLGLLTQVLGNNDPTIVVTAGNQSILLPNTLTANHTGTLGTAGAALPETQTIVRLDSTAHTYAVVNGGPGGGTLFTFPVNEKWQATFQFDGTDYFFASKQRLS